MNRAINGNPPNLPTQRQAVLSLRLTYSYCHYFVTHMRCHPPKGSEEGCAGIPSYPHHLFLLMFMDPPISRAARVTFREIIVDLAFVSKMFFFNFLSGKHPANIEQFFDNEE